MSLNSKKKYFDALIIGAGASGLYCAYWLQKFGLKVAILEKNNSAGKKILISGGGRCNFTNLKANSDYYFSENPRFCIGALKKHSPQDFLNLIQNWNLNYEEKAAGQLFFREKGRGFLEVLLEKINHIYYEQEVKNIYFDEEKALYYCNDFVAKNLIIATGAPSFPKLGATDSALQFAKKFQIKNIPFRPALVPLLLTENHPELSGISTKVKIFTENSPIFEDDLLFTHRGLSGPAVLQISTFWRKNEALFIDFLPDLPDDYFLQQKKTNPKLSLNQLLNKHLPHRLVNYFNNLNAEKALAEIKNQDLTPQGSDDNFYYLWRKRVIYPQQTAGMNYAEVCSGGIDTREINPKSMEVKKQKGLYFIGEALDVTGFLGGFNLQWAWSSAYACACDLQSKFLTQISET